MPDLITDARRSFFAHLAVAYYGGGQTDRYSAVGSTPGGLGAGGYLSPEMPSHHFKRANWEEGKHPRGQPTNRGQFARKTPMRTAAKQQQLGLFDADSERGKTAGEGPNAADVAASSAPAAAGPAFKVTRTAPARQRGLFEGEAGKAAGSPLVAQKPHATETPEFKAWFGDSKVVDQQGRPLVVYHGTSPGSSSKLTETKTWMNREGIYGWFDRDPERANGYAQSIDAAMRSKPGEELLDGSVFPVYLSIRNPKHYPNEYKFPTSKEEVDSLKSQGYDGVASPNTFAVFSPNQIKSATGNRGTFNQNDPRISYSAREESSSAALDFFSALWMAYYGGADLARDMYAVRSVPGQLSLFDAPATAGRTLGQWTEEDERKHPREHGKWAPKHSGGGAVGPAVSPAPAPPAPHASPPADAPLPDAPPAYDRNHELVAKAQSGDKQAMNDLFRANQGLVWRVARAYGKNLSPDQIDDLAQEGNFGLMAAVEKFDPSHGVKFSTYATYWIKSYVQRARSKVNPVLNRHLQQTHGGPSSEDPEQPLDPLRDVSAKTPDPTKRAERREVREIVEQALNDMHPKYAAILRGVFGFGEEGKQSLQQIADSLGVSAPRVHQMLQRAKGDLKEILAENVPQFSEFAPSFYAAYLAAVYGLDAAEVQRYVARYAGGIGGNDPPSIASPKPPALPAQPAAGRWKADPRPPGGMSSTPGSPPVQSSVKPPPIQHPAAPPKIADPPARPPQPPKPPTPPSHPASGRPSPQARPSKPVMAEIVKPTPQPQAARPEAARPTQQGSTPGQTRPAASGTSSSSKTPATHQPSPAPAPPPKPIHEQLLGMDHPGIKTLAAADLHNPHIESSRQHLDAMNQFLSSDPTHRDMLATARARREIRKLYGPGASTTGPTGRQALAKHKAAQMDILRGEHVQNLQSSLQAAAQHHEQFVKPQIEWGRKVAGLKVLAARELLTNAAGNPQLESQARQLAQEARSLLDHADRHEQAFQQHAAQVQQEIANGQQMKIHQPNFTPGRAVQLTPEQEAAEAAKLKKQQEEAAAFKKASDAEHRAATNPKKLAAQKLKDHAESWGMTPQQYDEIAKDVWRERQEHHADLERAKARARELTGLNAGDTSRHEEAGFDYSTMKGFDDIARTVVGEFPGLIPGAGTGYGDEGVSAENAPDYAGIVWHLLSQGKQELPKPHHDEYYDFVNDYLNSQHGGQSGGSFEPEGSEEEFEPGARDDEDEWEETGEEDEWGRPIRRRIGQRAVDDDEPVPFTLAAIRLPYAPTLDLYSSLCQAYYGRAAGPPAADLQRI